MRYLAPFGVFAAEDAGKDGRLDKIVADYVRLLTALTEGTLDFEKAAAAPLLNDVLDEAIHPEAASG